MMHFNTLMIAALAWTIVIKDSSSSAILKFPRPINGTTEGRNYIQGHIEVYHNGQWGTICDKLFPNKIGRKEMCIMHTKDFDHCNRVFNDNLVNLLCRMLRYDYGDESDAYKQRDVIPSDKIWLGNVRCTGNEAHVSNCSHDGWGSARCRHKQDVAIRCYEPRCVQRTNLCCTDTEPCLEDEGDCDEDSHCNGSLICGSENCLDARYQKTDDCCMLAPKAPLRFTYGFLAGKDKRKEYAEGYVEIFHDRKWGNYLCNDDLTDLTITVLCRMGGYDSGSKPLGSIPRTVSRPTKLFKLNNVKCTGNETHINRCAHIDLGIHHCRVLAIRCYRSVEKTSTFCTVAQPCMADQGNCDNHDQCNGSLVCGNNNCAGSQFNGISDCCMTATGGEMVLLFNAQQSSTGETHVSLTANRAIDGDYATMSETNGTKRYAWWSAELANLSDIQNVLISTTNSSVESGYFRRLKLTTKLEVNNPWKLCTEESLVQYRNTFALKCDNATTAKFINISVSMNHFRLASLRLSEVRVIGRYADINQSCGGNITENAFDFPKNGLKYRNNMNCSWTIQRSYDFVVTFKRFDIEACENCACDYLRLNHENVLCGSNLPEVLGKTSGQMKMMFQSDGSVTATGFKIEIINLESKGLSSPLNVDQRLTIALSSTVALLVLVVCIIIVVWYKRRHSFAPQLAPNTEWQFDPDRSVEDQLSELPYNLQWEFPRLDVTLKRLIGEGNFGEVWEAAAEGIAAFRPKDDTELGLRSKLANIYAREHNANDFWVKYFRQEYYPPQYSEEGQVAVKCLKPGAPEKDYTDFANELKLMIHIGSHKNIVNLMGACTQKGPLWMILEYCPQGDLRRYLRTKELCSTWNRLEMNSSDQLCFVDLIRMAMEITEGMIFLSTSGIIHRDLAARNILVGKNMEMKVADFGMARNVGNEDDEYNKESETAIPVRWTPPEAMNLGIYSTSSDVWSYAILLWEMFSMGEQPYGGMSNFDVKCLVERGERLKTPKYCPEGIYVIMKTCWNAEPVKRPSFLDIFEILLEVRRNAFAPSADYYSGSGTSEQADVYTSDAFIDCRPVLREKRIKWLKDAGVDVTEENVEDILNQIWGKPRYSNEDITKPGLPFIENQNSTHFFDNAGYAVEDVSDQTKPKREEVVQIDESGV